MKNNNYIKVGSYYLLSKKEAYCVIDYLKKTKQWNTKYIDKFMMVDSDFIFNKCKLFPVDFKKNNCEYSYSDWDVTDYFNYNNGIYYVINSYKKNSNQKYYSYWILKEDIEDGEFNIGSLPQKLLKEDVLFLIERYSTNKVNTFDFNRFDYFIESINLEEYIIDSNDKKHKLLRWPFYIFFR